MALFRHHKFLVGALLCVAATLTGTFIYANRILSRVMPSYLASVLPGRIVIGDVSGSLIYGIRLFDVRYHPETPRGPTVKPVFKAKEIRIGYDLVKSLMLKDRYVTVSAISPTIDVDVNEILFDPSIILRLQPLLAQNNIVATLWVEGGKLILTGMKGPFGSISQTFELSASMAPTGALLWSSPVSTDLATAQVRGNFDTVTRKGRVDVSFTSSFLASHPLEGAGWTLSTPVEGRTAIDFVVVEPKTKSPPNASRVPFGPRLVLDATMAGNLVAKAGVLEHKKKQIRFIGVTAAGTFSKGELRILEGSIPVSRGKVTPSGQMSGWDPRQGHLELSLAEVDPTEVPQLLPFALAGRVSGKIRLALDHPIHLDLTGTSLTGEIFSFDRAHLIGQLQGSRLLVDSLAAQSVAGSGLATGVVDADANRFDFSADFRSFPQKAFKSLLDGFRIQDGLFTGHLTGSGSLKPYVSDRWTFDFQIEKPTIADYSGTSGVLVGTFIGRNLDVPRLEMVRKEYWDQARFQVSSTPEAGFRTKGIVRGLKLDRLAPGFTGIVDCGVAVGTVGSEVIELAKGEVRNLGSVGSSKKVPPLTFHISGARGGGHALEISDRKSFEIMARLGRLKPGEISPSALFKKKVTGRFKIRDLAPFARILSAGHEDLVQEGRLEGTFTTESIENHLSLATRVDRLFLKTSQGALSSQSFQFSYRNGKIVLPKFIGRFKGAPLELSGSISTTGPVDMAVKIDGIPVQVPAIWMSKDETPSNVDGEPRKAESPAKTHWQMPLTFSSLDSQGQRPSTKLQLRERPSTATQPETIRANLSSALRINGTLDRPVIDGDVTLADLSVPGEFESEVSGTLDGHLTLKDDVLVVRDCMYRTDRVACSVKGSLPVHVDLRNGVCQPGSGPIDLNLDFPRTDARIVSLLAPSLVSRASGTLQARLCVTGTVQAPVVTGNFDVAARSLRLSGLPDPVEDVNLSLVFGDRKMTVKSCSGRFMSGTVSATGSLPFGSDQKGRGYAIKVAARGLNYAKGQIHLSRVNSDLTLSGSASEPKLDGEVRFEKGVVRLPFPKDQVGTGFAQALPMSGGNVATNVRVDVPGNLWIKSNQLDAEMKGAIILAGKGHDVKVRGELETIRGNLFFQNRSIRLSEGSIKFLRPQRDDFLNFTDLDDPSLNAHLDGKTDIPYVSFRAQTDVDSVKVFVDAKGYAVPNGIKLSVRSLPPMEESQIVAVLVTGKQSFSDLNGKEVPTLLTNSLAGEVAHSLVDRQLESAFQKALGFDDIRINSNLLSLGGGEERRRPAVTVGKYIAPNVYVAADGRLDNSSGFFQRLELDLKLDKSLALTVERALSDSPGSSSGLFDRTNYSTITANETRWGISKQLKW